MGLGSCAVMAVAVALAVAAPAAAQGSVHGCPRQAFCIYEDPNFRGAHLKLIRCKVHRLSSYAFIHRHGRFDSWDGEASSWVNNQILGSVATLWSGDNARGRSFESSGLADDRVGRRWNDKVSSVKPC